MKSESSWGFGMWNKNGSIQNHIETWNKLTNALYFLANMVDRIYLFQFIADVFFLLILLTLLSSLWIRAQYQCTTKSAILQCKKKITENKEHLYGKQTIVYACSKAFQGFYCLQLEKELIIKAIENMAKSVWGAKGKKTPCICLRIKVAIALHMLFE